MKDSSQIENSIILLPQYGKQKLLYCAENYRNLAKSFMDFTGKEKEEIKLDRKSFLYYRQAAENRAFMAEQYLDMAERITEIATKSFNYIPTDHKEFKQIQKLLKTEQIEVEHIYFLEDEKADGVLEITMKKKKGCKDRIPASDIAAMIGIHYQLRLLSASTNSYFVEEEYQSYTFLQEPAYSFMAGVAQAIKEGETVSGDNIHIIEQIQGKAFFLLADGVGSGEQASKNSDSILDFLEKFMNAGYRKELAIQMLNGLILQDGQEKAMSTLDICEVDLYKGVCEFSKIGATASYYKRENRVEKIEVPNLPLGAFGTVNLDVIRKRVEDQEYIIMVSDGVIEALTLYKELESLEHYIEQIKDKNPKEMANKLLRFTIEKCAGAITDDMSFFVIGIWKR